MRDLKDKGEEEQSIQQVDVSAEKHVKTKDPLFGWTATDRPLELPPDNLDGDVNKSFCPVSGGRTYPHQKFDDEEAQGIERDQRAGIGSGGG